MSDVGITSDLLPSRKQQRKSYKEVPEEDFEEEESSEDEKAPVKAKATAKESNGGDDEEEDDEEEDLDEDEFVVEKIFAHYIDEDVCWAPQNWLPFGFQGSGVLIAKCRVNRNSRSSGKAGLRRRIAPGRMRIT